MANAPLVLCIDDDPALLTMETAVLESGGLAAITALRGRDGLTLAATQPVRAAVVDYNLPDINGHEVALRLRDLAPRLPLVLYTGMRDVIPQGTLRLFDAVVEKGERSDTLLQTVQALISRSGVRAAMRYPVVRPVVIRAERQQLPLVIRGESVDLSEAGLGGVVHGELFPGETVSLTLPLSILTIHTAARVCYQRGSRCGFQFVGLGDAERASIRTEFPKFLS